MPLSVGVADRFIAAGRPILGPTRAAARLETSKAWAKQFMACHHVPTARFVVAESTDTARAVIDDGGLGWPLVVKADGLAAGKGVVLAADPDEAWAVAGQMLAGDRFGEAGRKVVFEECLEGPEVSFFVLTDGHHGTVLGSAQDHKRAHDGDRGPNTGGMGAYAPVSIAADALVARALDEIFRPTLAGLAAEGIAFSGVLYAGLMLTADGPRVLEWNARFGDPECEALLPLLESDLLELLVAASPGGSGLAGVGARWREGACVSVVAASDGYPDAYDTGVPIRIPADVEGGGFDESGVVVFHAGTRREGGEVVTAGGRVLDVTAVGADIDQARSRAYAALDRIGGEGLRWRSDIGWRELARVEGHR
jgi:phosphoribosylamine--glycine ligase